MWNPAKNKPGRMLKDPLSSVGTELRLELSFKAVRHDANGFSVLHSFSLPSSVSIFRLPLPSSAPVPVLLRQRVSTKFHSPFALILSQKFQPPLNHLPCRQTAADESQFKSIFAFSHRNSQAIPIIVYSITLQYLIIMCSRWIFRCEGLWLPSQVQHVHPEEVPGALLKGKGGALFVKLYKAKQS